MIVVDVSVVVDFIIDSTSATAAMTAMVGHELRAPDLIDFEVMAAIRRLTMAAHLREDEAHQALWSFQQLNISRTPSELLIPRAFELRYTVGAGDAVYIALAEAIGCALITTDGRFARSHGHGAEVELVA